jgi:hypothetical protein
MNGRDFHLVNDRGQLRVSELQRMGALAGAAVMGPLGAIGGYAYATTLGTLLNIDLPFYPLLSITGAQKADKSWPFKQVVEIPTQPITYEDPANPITDALIPLFEINNDAIADNTVVRAWLSEDGTHYLCSVTGTGSTTQTVVQVLSQTPAGGGTFGAQNIYPAVVGVWDALHSVFVFSGARIWLVNPDLSLPQFFNGVPNPGVYSAGPLGVTFTGTHALVAPPGTLPLYVTSQNPPATGTGPGIVNTVNQTLGAGTKTFTNDIVLGRDPTLNLFSIEAAGQISCTDLLTIASPSSPGSLVQFGTQGSSGVMQLNSGAVVIQAMVGAGPFFGIQQLGGGASAANFAVWRGGPNVWEIGVDGTMADGSKVFGGIITQIGAGGFTGVL